ncbi:aldo/keto reductase [Actinoallomurus rhizosphaericola]|uniref:aldo/keto reductase n=1 Tax=Actinoallomurus rhizosphaericola TaxID=2952536 RepID=UPI002093B623|nr:aldo/keto reductase [Actinoallomurus rhizosphaericola]MCO5997648.1 aldo/keto reductase [Actinoallomurus rhizosphaericola]
METSDRGAHRDAVTTATASFAGRTVFRVGYGAAQLDRLRDRRGEAVALLRRAVELGVNHVDTAEFYGFGFANAVIREALRPEDGVLVVTKVGADPDPGGRLPLRIAQRPEQLRASVEDNLRSLGVDRLPVVNLRRLDTGPGLRPEGDQVVDLDDQLAVMTALRDEGKIGAIGLSSVTLDGLRRALPAGVVCVQNAYSLVSRADEELLRLCAAEGIAWVPFFPLGGAFPGLPKVTEESAVHAVAESLGATPSQVGLAWLLHHAPNVLLIPGTADPAHLEANMAVGALTLDDAALAVLDAVESRSNDVPIG